MSAVKSETDKVPHALSENELNSTSISSPNMNTKHASSPLSSIMKGRIHSNGSIISDLPNGNGTGNGHHRKDNEKDLHHNNNNKNDENGNSIPSPSRPYQEPKEVPNYHLLDHGLTEDTGLREQRHNNGSQVRFQKDYVEDENNPIEIQIKESTPPVPNPDGLPRVGHQHQETPQNQGGSSNTTPYMSTKKRLSIIPRLATEKMNTSETKELLQKKLQKFRRNKHPAQDPKNYTSHTYPIDHHDELEKKSKMKSKALIDSLMAGTPIALITATMMTTDERGTRRAPLLLQLLTIAISDITESPFSKKRQYRIDLEYGVGPNSLKWSIQKSLKDILSLHHAIRLAYYQSSVLKATPDVDLPKFPKFKFKEPNNRDRDRERNYTRMDHTHRNSIGSILHMKKSNHSSQPIVVPSDVPPPNTNNGNNTRSPMASPQLSKVTAFTNNHMNASQNGDNSLPRNLSSAYSNEDTTFDNRDDRSIGYENYNPRYRNEHSPTSHHMDNNADEERHDMHSLNSNHSHLSMDSIETNLSNWKHLFSRAKKQNESDLASNPEELREALEGYFNLLFRVLMTRVQANKLFQFFELSPIGVLLANENREKRKEGNMFIRTSAKAQGWRVGHLRASDLKAMVDRHTPKWFIIGDSYIAYVDDMYSTTPLDVFLVDSKFHFTLSGAGETITNENFKDLLKRQADDDDDEFDVDDGDIGSIIVEGSKKPLKEKSYFLLALENSERKMSTVALSAKQMKKWAYAIGEMALETPWSNKNRFNSFAPVRDNCFAQWLVDGRDYFWAASSAIEMATDVIYIHDWWLSPELYMRRPANGNQFWRIDRLLKRKAEQGVKIFVIVYRNVGNTVVTDSLWTKHSLLDLHENIYVLRSPNQLMQNVYFWAHHEKLLIVDQNVCFLGGIDLCFGRYDTPDHVLTDDKRGPFNNGDTGSSSTSTNGNQSTNDEETKNPLEYQMFPGKDYSNARVKDFSDLNEPFTDMYDRDITPRMPWHDVHMVSTGQVARDLSRHFVQRWNYLLRQKRPSRPTPLLLPPSDLTPEELKSLNVKGTCEIQLLRSSCNWSLGLQDHEQSIQNAYLKAIETSEKFIYIENQFFITSAEFDGVVVKNKIGDALVERIIRAHKNRETWKAVIVIPLMPGFESQVDTKEGSSIRLIMQCQYMSISMGNDSIFAKLRQAGVLRPEDYIQFFSLRKYGKIGPNKLLVTEQLYIHAKILIADDRTAIIGSANINERSMRGTRDSEVCAMVRDKEMIDSYMDGKPYKVGKFAHTLRMRLMREHLGVDVDLLEMVERRFTQIEKFARTEEGIKASTICQDDKQTKGDNDTQVPDLEDDVLSAMVELGARYILNERGCTSRFKNIKGDTFTEQNQITDSMYKFFDVSKEAKDLDEIVQLYSFNHRAGKENAGIRDKKNFSTDARVTTESHRKDVSGHGTDAYHSAQYLHSKDKVTRILQAWSDSACSSKSQIDYLPTYEDILDFLENDDTSVPLSTLNAERWDMLKRIHYLQKYMARKQKLIDDILSSQRPTSNSQSGIGTSASHDTDASNNNNSNNGHTANTTTFNSNTNNPNNMGGDSPPLPNIETTYPTTALNDSEIKELDQHSLPQTSYSFIDPYAFEDPLEINFYEGLWLPQAMKNTLVFQSVFHVQPDDYVQTWRDYKYFEELKKAFMASQQAEKTGLNRNYSNRGASADSTGLNPNPDEMARAKTSDFDTLREENSVPAHPSSSNTEEEDFRSTLRRARIAELERFQRGNIRGTKNAFGIGGDFQAVYDYETAEKLLGLIRGNLVLFPTSWLKKEVESSNWFYAADKLPPIEIYD